MTPLLPHNTLRDLGFSMVIHPCLVTYRIAYAIKDLLERFRSTGDSNPFLNEILSFHDYNQLVGLSEIREKEQQLK